MHTSLKRVALFSRRRYRLVFGLTAVLVVVSLAMASRLRFDTDILSLLPKNEPVVDEFRLALEQFGSVDRLLVAVRVPEDSVLDPYEEFVDALGRRLEALPLLDEVEYHIGNLEELVVSYLPTALVFLDESELERVAAKVSDEGLGERAREIKRLIATPQSFLREDLLRLDPFGVADLLLERVDTSRSGLEIDWASGYFLSRDHRMLLLLGRPSGPPQDVDFSKELVARVEAEIALAQAEWPSFLGRDPVAVPPPPEVVLGGRHVVALGDAELIKGDVIANVATSMIGVLALFLLAFRRFGPLLYALIPLSCGLILTFGVASMSYGVLSSATSGVAALLIGLGIDFVIVSYGRFVEERQRGAVLEEALTRMSGSSGRAVFVGGVTSAATFYSFGVTDFTGLYQMGFLTGTGILLCMAAVIFLLPALLSWSEDHHERRQRVPRRFLHGFGSGRVIKMSLAWPRLVLVVGLVITLLAAVSATRLEFEDSISAMRPEGNRGVEVRDEVAERYGVGFDQMMLIVTAPTSDEVLSLADQASRAASRLVDDGVLTDVDTVSSILPPPQSQRRALDWLAEHRRSTALDFDRIESVFATELAREGVRAEAFSRGVDLFRQAASRREPVSIDEIERTTHGKRLIERYLHDADGRWRSVVYLYPPPKEWRREAPPQTVEMARRLGDQTLLTGANVISRFLRERVLEDALLASVLGFVLVGILLWLDFRRLDSTILSLAPLVMGIVWMLGAMAALEIPMNFMNIFVSTMIIGIGVDYGVHMIHRHREFSRQSPERLSQGLVQTGKAITIAALSTIVGFGSLARSSYPGLASMGIVAILGAVFTGVVAITVLPAYFAWRRRDAANT
ncbi:MAG: MMPL family transporter [Acidobacteriota bacterium]|nr:MMPL family transporter [Acidobacteriota bacterium]